jgi:TolB-like protein
MAQNASPFNLRCGCGLSLEHNKVSPHGCGLPVTRPRKRELALYGLEGTVRRFLVECVVVMLESLCYRSLGVIEKWAMRVSETEGGRQKMKRSKLTTIFLGGCAAGLLGCSSQVTYQGNEATAGTGSFPVVESPMNQGSPVKTMVVDQGIPKSARITVASFANIDDLTRVSSLGRYLSEFYANELVRYGYPVYDMEAQDEVMLMQYVGAIYRTRQGPLQDGTQSQIRPQAWLLAKGIRYVLTGTYTALDNRVIVQARLIDVTDSRIVASESLSLERQGMVAELANRGLPAPPPPVDKRLEVVGP